MSSFVKFPGLRWASCLLWLLAIADSFALEAQAPLDGWRRSGLEPMVAEPGLAASIFVNPAGLKTKQERHKLAADRTQPGQKSEWLFELASIDLLLTSDTWALLLNPAGFLARLSPGFDSLTAMKTVFKGVETEADKKAAAKAVKLVQGLGQELYSLVRERATLGGAAGRGKDLPKNVGDLTVEHLENMGGGTRSGLRLLFDTYKEQSQFYPVLKELPHKFAASFIQNFTNDIGELGVREHLRLLELRHANNEKPLAWGFSFGLEQTAILRRRVNARSVGMPLDVKIPGSDFRLQTDVPIGLQIYVTAPLRLALAHDFNEKLPGFTFGLGLKAVPYFGFNQTTIGNFLSNATTETGEFWVNNEKINKALTQAFGMNAGLDFGMQYHFGAITPKLGFLHFGLKISDLVGFNIPFSNTGDQFRYAIDFDVGVYANFQNARRLLEVFGGVELIQMRGLFAGGQSPHSSLFEPLDHLRLQGGISLWDNVFRLSVQFYNQTISPALLLNVGIVQLHAALNFSIVEEDSWGVEISLRFRGPHNGHNIRRPYRTYRELAAQNKAINIDTENVSAEEEVKAEEKAAGEPEEQELENAAVESAEEKELLESPPNNTADTAANAEK